MTTSLLENGPFLGSRGPFPTPNPSVGVVVAVPSLTNANAGTPDSTSTTGASVDSDVGNGRLYWAVLTAGGTCTNAQLKAGSGGNIVSGKSGNQSVLGTGTQPLSDITGLTPSTTYILVFLQTNSIGSDSAQASVALVTTA